jgi:ABC-type Na+ efflux pump permease subunit
MHKAFLVAQREYLENIRTKGFWIGILVFPIMLTLFIAVPTLLERTKSARQYAVIDQSGWLLREVDRRVTARDLTRVFAAAAGAAREGAEGVGRLAPPLRDLAPVLTGLNDVQIGQFAEHVVFGDSAAAPDGEGLPEPARRMAAEHGAAVLAWWDGVTPAEARELARGVSKAQYVRVDVDAEGNDAPAVLSRMVGDEELFAYFVVGTDPVSGDTPSRYVSNNLTDDDLKDWFAEIASDVVRARRLAREQISPQVAGWIQQPVRFEERKITGEGEEAEVDARDQLRQWAPVIFVYLLWISVFTVSQMLLTNTVEEKSNRTIEVLLSSVSPVQLMGGKIAGIAATGLTVVVSWIVFFIAATKLLPSLMGVPASLDLSVLATDPVYIVSFIGYFILGYLLYAAILVGIGSVVNTLKEAQNLMTPITLLLVAPLLAMVPIGKDPNGTLAQVLSYIPPFTPFVMMNRAAGPPSLFEYVSTTILLLLSTVVALWAAAKVFRIGVLLTGKPPRLPEILRWIRAPVGSVPVRKGSAV